MSELPAIASVAPGRSAAAPSPPVTSLLSASDLINALLDCAFRLIPKVGDTTKSIAAEMCPFIGLKRTALYEMFELRNEREIPRIKTVFMCEDEEERATRLHSAGSVLLLPRQKARKRAKEERNKTKLAENHGKYSS